MMNSHDAVWVICFQPPVSFIFIPVFMLCFHPITRMRLSCFQTCARHGWSSEHDSGCVFLITVSCSDLHPAKLTKHSWSLQPRCSWSSGRDIGLPMCANGRCLIGVRRRYDHLLIPAQWLLEFVDLIFFLLCLTVGGTDPGNCEQCQLWAKGI